MIQNKITIIGAGLVGSTIAHTLMLSSLASDIVLIDINKEKTEGEVMDLRHCTPALLPVNVYPGDYSDCADSKIIIITAGIAQNPNESRLNLAQRNTEVFQSIIGQIKPYYDNSVILVVTNPVDILTYVTIKLLNRNPYKIIGSGTILDTARFRYILNEYLNVDSRNISAYIIGEHGDQSVPVWSAISVSGININNFQIENEKIAKIKQKIHDEVVKSAYQIIERKGSTYYGIAVAIRTVVESIIRNHSGIFPVSTLMNGQYGIDDVCLSLPVIIDSSGIKKVLNLSLSTSEIQNLRNSANLLKSVLSNLNYNSSFECDPLNDFTEQQTG